MTGSVRRPLKRIVDHIALNEHANGWTQIVYKEQWFSWRGKKCLPSMVIFLSVSFYWGVLDQPMHALRKQEAMPVAIALTMMEEPQALFVSLGDFLQYIRGMCSSGSFLWVSYAISWLIYMKLKSGKKKENRKTKP